MAGGLMQIVSYGNQDLFLTGVPEITFFKVVYRRHTSFSMESIKVDFDNNTGFGSTSIVKIPKIGDLMHRTYLEITLPKVDLLREIDSDVRELQDNLTNAENDYRKVTDFMIINRTSFVSAYGFFIPVNNPDATSDMIIIINDTFSRAGNQDTINNMAELLTLTENVPFTYNEISMQAITDNFDDSSLKEDIFRALEYGINKSIKTQDFFFKRVLDARDALNDAQSENIKFAWVEKIGTAIIDKMDIKIGGQVVDKQNGDWLNIWKELSLDRNLEKLYDKLIGNVSSLTNFDRTVKEAYTLRVPLQFWFCRFSGLSLPLIALQYHNITFSVRFKHMHDVSYIEEGEQIKSNQLENGITLKDVPSEKGINLTANLLIDYIFLDTKERKRFAQSSHEYLIEQLQVYEQKNVTQKEVQIIINNFVHPTKEIIWVSQKRKYINNFNDNIPTQWHNYSMTDENKGNPIAFSSMDFNSYNRVIRLDGNYFNYLQPYATHLATPSDGINVYSFSLFPEEHQPSGSANFSKISRIVMHLELDSTLFDATGVILDPVNIRIYTRNLNILRFMNGIGGLAWVYG